MRHLLVLVALASLALTGCATQPPAETATPTPPPGAAEKDVVRGLGTILYQDLEGGFYGLVSDDGVRYDPLNLDEAFRQDSLRVRFRARRRTDVMTIRMWGQPLEILDIARLDQE